MKRLGLNLSTRESDFKSWWPLNLAQIGLPSGWHFLNISTHQHKISYEFCTLLQHVCFEIKEVGSPIWSKIRTLEWFRKHTVMFIILSISYPNPFYPSILINVCDICLSTKRVGMLFSTKRIIQTETNYQYESVSITTKPTGMVCRTTSFALFKWTVVICTEYVVPESLR